MSYLDKIKLWQKLETMRKLKEIHLNKTCKNFTVYIDVNDYESEKGAQIYIKGKYDSVKIPVKEWEEIKNAIKELLDIPYEGI